MKPVAKRATPAAIAVLRQATALVPKRNKASDGLLPSKAHIAQSPNSDHNTGLAVDLTHDPKAGIDCAEIFEKLLNFVIETVFPVFKRFSDSLGGSGDGLLARFTDIYNFIRDFLEPIFDAVRDHAVQRIRNGDLIHGWQMVPKRATRKWTDEAAALQALTDAGIDKSKLVLAITSCFASKRCFSMLK